MYFSYRAPDRMRIHRIEHRIECEVLKSSIGSSAEFSNRAPDRVRIYHIKHRIEREIFESSTGPSPNSSNRAPDRVRTHRIEHRIACEVLKSSTGSSAEFLNRAPDRVRIHQIEHRIERELFESSTGPSPSSSNRAPDRVRTHRIERCIECEFIESSTGLSANSSNRAPDRLLAEACKKGCGGSGTEIDADIRSARSLAKDRAGGRDGDSRGMYVGCSSTCLFGPCTGGCDRAESENGGGSSSIRLLVEAWTSGRLSVGSETGDCTGSTRSSVQTREGSSRSANNSSTCGAQPAKFAMRLARNKTRQLILRAKGLTLSVTTRQGPLNSSSHRCGNRNTANAIPHLERKRRAKLELCDRRCATHDLQSETMKSNHSIRSVDLGLMTACPEAIMTSDAEAEPSCDSERRIVDERVALVVGDCRG